MSGIFDLRGYIGNLRLATMGAHDKVIEMRSADVRLHFSDLTRRMSASRQKRPIRNGIG